MVPLDSVGRSCTSTVGPKHHLPCVSDTSTLSDVVSIRLSDVVSVWVGLTFLGFVLTSTGRVVIFSRLLWSTLVRSADSPRLQLAPSLRLVSQSLGNTAATAAFLENAANTTTLYAHLFHVHPIACTSKTHPLRWHGANRQGPNPLKRSSRSEDGPMM